MLDPIKDDAEPIGDTSAAERFASRALDNTWVKLALALVAILGLGIPVFTIVTSQDPVLRPGTPAATGPFAVTPEAVTCGKGVADIPAAVLSEIPENIQQSFEQICLVPTKIRNDANIQLQAAVGMVLVVRSDQYPSVAGDPLIAPLLSPDQVGDTTFIFSIPPGVQPTQLRFRALIAPEGDPKPKEKTYVV